MKRKLRQTILLTLLFIFILFAPILILHFQGYRIDLEERRLTQTGGLFVKTIPKQTDIYLNDKLSKKTDFFFGSVLIESLLPKRHNIKVKKDGYSSWEKTLEIKEKEVTEVKNIVLFPEDLPFELLGKGILDVWFSKDNKIIVWKEEKDNLWSLKLYNLEKNFKSLLINEKDFPENEAELIALNFLEEEKNLINIEIIIEEQLKNFLIDISQELSTLKETSELPSLDEDIIVAQKDLDGNIYTLDNFGHLYKNNTFLSTKEKITKEPFPLKQEIEYTIYPFRDFIFLKDGERNLYLLDQKEKVFKKFSEDVRDLEISPDLKKLAYFSGREIHVLFLKEQNSQPTKRKGENLFLFRLSEEITDIFWITSNYLSFNTENGIKITEIDDRDKINTVTITDFKNSELFWNSKNKRFYVLVGENLWVSNKLLP